jgi:serine carboxypeptidase-like clade 2
VEWRPWYIAGEFDSKRQNAGNFWKLNGLTFVSIKDAGHMVPTDKRPEALALFSAFLKDAQLPSS